MPWVKLSDDWYDDPAMTEAGTLGLAMYVVGLSWCARNLTDGKIPKSQARKLIDLDDIMLDGASCRADDIASRLVELGLWSRTDSGYLVVDYHRNQPTREKVIADREKDRRRKSSRSSPPEDDPHGFHSESGSKAARNPDPPVSRSNGSSVVTSSLATHDADAKPDDDDELSTGVPEETWTHYADLRFNLEPAGSVLKPIPWKAKTAKNARTEQGSRAAQWWATWELSPYRLAQCLVDGKPPMHVPRREAS